MNDKENMILKKRIAELADATWQRDVPSCTDFLGLEEQTVFHSVLHDLPPVRYLLDGGYEDAERRVVCFLPSYSSESGREHLPVVRLAVTPRDLRFAEKLTHRDYLGSLMNLGIERSNIGDILVSESGAQLFCLERMADYLCEEFRRVRHTDVDCVRAGEEEEIARNYLPVGDSVASPRLDAVIALVFRLSRGKVTPYIEGGKVFCDGRQVLSAAHQLKEGEVVSVRGLGKFRFLGVEKETRKGRCFVNCELFA